MHILIQCVATGKTTRGYSGISIGIRETNRGEQNKAMSLLLTVSDFGDEPDHTRSVAHKEQGFLPRGKTGEVRLLCEVTVGQYGI